MKLNTRNVTKKSGMTLLELTVVILVLLSLISILFIGARAWKKGSDRAGCIMNIRNVQQALRGHQNMTNSASTDSVASTALIGTNGYLGNNPTCPAGGTYNYGSTFGDLGTVYTTCSLASTLQHAPSGSTADW